MRKEVYVKFAEALGNKKASDRRQEVHTKLAEALQQRQLQKQAAGRFGAAIRGIGKLYGKLSPEVKKPGKFNPMRLFTTTKQELQTARNSPALSGAPSAAGAGASGGSTVGGKLPSFSELPNQSTRDVTRLSPAKILAALGLTSGAAGTAKALSGKTAPAPAPVPASNGGWDEIWAKVMANKKLVAALAAAGLLTAGGIGYAMAGSGDDKKKGYREV